MLARCNPPVIYVFVLFLAVISACSVLEPYRDRGSAQEGYLSPETVVADHSGNTLYVADATAQNVKIVDIATGRVKKTVPLHQNPNGLALSPDGSRLYVTTGLAEGHVEEIDLTRGKVTHTVAAGHTPCAPVVSSDGSTLYLCNRFDASVTAIDLVDTKEPVKVPMLREPVAAALTPDDKYLFVANHLPTGKIIYDYVKDAQTLMIGSYMSSSTYGGRKMDYAAAGVVLAVDTATGKLCALIALPNGSTGLRGLCVSPGGRYAYVTHVLANYKHTTSQIERGAINSNAISVIDVRTLRLITTVLLDEPGRGAANPWDVACSPDGACLIVSHSGTHEISIIDRIKLHERIDAALQTNDFIAIPSDSLHVSSGFSFLDGIRTRVSLTGLGPRGTAVAGKTVYVAEYFSDSVGVITYGSSGTPEVRSISLGPEIPMTERRRGELLFSDARLCREEWQSCASCHPEGRSDGLTWDLLNDGTGNAKKTKSLLLAHATPPSMVTGIRADAETAVRAGLKYIHFTGQPEETAVAIDTYLKSLRPVPSPYLTNGKLSADARRGKKIFDESGCRACHTPSLFTDMKKYDIGQDIGTGAGILFDTPTLIESWRTEPYLYDGRAVSIDEVVSHFNKNDAHGTTSHLDSRARYYLTQYILSL